MSKKQELSDLQEAVLRALLMDGTRRYHARQGGPIWALVRRGLIARAVPGDSETSTQGERFRYRLTEEGRKYLEAQYDALAEDSDAERLEQLLSPERGLVTATRDLRVLRDEVLRLRGKHAGTEDE